MPFFGGRGVPKPGPGRETEKTSFFGQRKEVPKIELKEKPKGISLFGGKKEISRRKLREKLEKASPNIPGTTRKFYRRERVDLEKKEFGKKDGLYLSKHELKERIREWEKERSGEKDTVKRRDLKDKISFFKKLDKS